MKPFFDLMGYELEQEKANYYNFAAMSFYTKYQREIYGITFITFCIAFSIDLYFTIKNPLKSPDKRMKFYWASVLVNLVLLFTIESLTIPSCSIMSGFMI